MGPRMGGCTFSWCYGAVRALFVPVPMLDGDEMAVLAHDHVCGVSPQYKEGVCSEVGSRTLSQGR